MNIFNSFLAESDMSDIVMNSLLFIALILIVGSAWRFHRSGKYKQFTLFDFICQLDGRLDPPKAIAFMVFLVMTWAFVAQAVKGTLTWEYAGGYAAIFVVNHGMDKYFQGKFGNGNGKAVAQEEKKQ